jgi:tryptophan synthase alpha chain
VSVAPRLAAAFAAPRARRAALIPYFTGGWPDLETSHRLVTEVIAAGADIVELGVPFSDPVADGPVVQRSAHEALLAGITPDDVFDVAAAHSAEVPFVLLTYVNTVLAYGPERFFARASGCGVEALVVPDLPVDEMTSHLGDAPALLDVALAQGVALVPLAAPTSTDERLDLVAAAAGAFVYCVAVTGVTGARRELGSELPTLIARLRARTAAPLAAGFGISTAEQAGHVAGIADGVIIGSALIAAAASGEGAVGALTRAAAAAIAG